MLHAYDLEHASAVKHGLTTEDKHWLARNVKWVQGLAIRITSQGGFRARQIENIATRDPGLLMAPKVGDSRDRGVTVNVQGNGNQSTPTKRASFWDKLKNAKLD